MSEKKTSEVVENPPLVRYAGGKKPVKAKHEMAFFRDEESADSPAFPLVFECFGQTFYCREASRSLINRLGQVRSETAKRLGIEESLMDDTAFMALNPQVALAAADVLQGLYDEVLDACLGDWSLPRPCTAENHRKATMVLRRAIVERIVSGSNFGVTDPAFFTQQ